MSQLSEFIPQAKEPLLIVISGPSGVGKDSVLEILKQRNVEFHFVVTHHPSTDGCADYIF
jgi:guanylate kinase